MMYMLSALGTSVDSAEGLAAWRPWQSDDHRSLGFRANWIEDPGRHWYMYTRVRADGVTVASYSGPTGDHLVDHQVATWSMDIGGDGD
jgi:hypothetical protein